MLEVGFALRPQVDDDVEQSAADAPHELGVRSRRKLKMHSAHSASFPIRGDAGLGNERIQPRCRNSCRQKLRAKKPLSSSRRSSSMTKAPLSLVSVKITGLLTRRLAERGQSHAGAASRAARTPSAIRRWMCPMR